MWWIIGALGLITVVAYIKLFVPRYETIGSKAVSILEMLLIATAPLLTQIGIQQISQDRVNKASLQNKKTDIVLERKAEENQDIREEIVKLINLYGEAMQKGNEIVTLVRNKYYPLNETENVNILDFNKKTDYFTKDLYPKINDSYRRIISFYGVHLDKDVISIINGLVAFIYTSEQCEKFKREMLVGTMDNRKSNEWNIWWPEEIKILPAKTREEYNILNQSFQKQGLKQELYLLDFRRQLIEKDPE
jgi:hypothetical protein